VAATIVSLMSAVATSWRSQVWGWGTDIPRKVRSNCTCFSGDGTSDIPIRDPSFDGRGFADKYQEVHHLIADGGQDLIGQADARHQRNEPVATNLPAQRQHVAPEGDIVPPTLSHCRSTATKDIAVNDEEVGTGAEVIANR
jgi:hypothetical protein